MKEYLEAYPEGTFYLAATYYLAEILYEKQDYENAIPAYSNLTQGSVNNYSEKALVRLISLLKNKEQIVQAIPYMEKLDTIASFSENRRFALFNLMQAYYLVPDYPKTLKLTERVLNIPNLEQSIQWDALTIKAKSSLALNDSLTAESTYKILETAPLSSTAAEAIYFRAFKLYKNKKYEESNSLIDKIAQLGGSTGVWNVKALLLLAKNYFELEDTFQAVFVLESIIKNFDGYPEQIEESKSLLEIYKNNSETTNPSANEN